MWRPQCIASWGRSVDDRMYDTSDRFDEIVKMYEQFGVGLDDIDSWWLIMEVKRLRNIPEAIARKCETSARLHHNPQAVQAYTKAASIARDLGNHYG
jgi:hypothetical protein